MLRPDPSCGGLTVIPDLDLARVRKWIDGRSVDMAPEVREQIRYEIDVTELVARAS